MDPTASCHVSLDLTSWMLPVYLDQTSSPTKSGPSFLECGNWNAHGGGHWGENSLSLKKNNELHLHSMTQDHFCEKKSLTNSIFVYAYLNSVSTFPYLCYLINTGTSRNLLILEKRQSRKNFSHFINKSLCHCSVRKCLMLIAVTILWNIFTDWQLNKLPIIKKKKTWLFYLSDSNATVFMVIFI